ncbi:DKNYY family protein [Escherichia albertii]|nr:DKNYY family protein [Escherichia albertii]
MINTARQDGFMHYRNVVCLLSYSLFLSSAWGCRLDEPEHNVYQQQGKGVVYLRPYEETNLFLSGVNYKRLRRLPNLLIDPKTLDEWDEIPPLTDLTTDYLYEGAQAWFPHYAYHSDGRYILYAGKVVQNPPDKPLVDVASFKAWGDFAADKNSLYFEGKRADSNGGENSLDIKTLHQVKFPHPWKPDFLGLILRDAKFLYVDGHRLADPDSFRVLAQKSWDQRGKFSTEFNPCVAVPFGPWDTLARTQTKIMINGEQLNADPETFTVVRWMPGSLLSWRDKSGLHRKVLNQGNLDKDMAKNCATFGVQEHDVSWRKGPKCQQEILPGLDPEQFHPLSKTVAQYQDKLYVIKKTEFGENKLDIVTLDNPNLVIDKRFNAGRTHGYLLTKLQIDGEEEDSLQVFESSGPLILLDYRVPGEREAHLGDSPHYKKWYAHDDRYVYAFDGSQLWRYPTPNTKAVRVKWKTEHSGYGYWAVKWHTEFGHLNRGDMLTSEQHRCSNEKKKF